MQRLRLFTVCLLLSVSVLAAQSAQTAKLSGKVVDATGAVMSTVDVKAYQKGQLVKAGQTDDQGNFSLDLAPGQYGVEIAAPDFRPFRQEVQVNSTLAPLAVTLEVAATDQLVEVREDLNAVSVDLETSLGATTITGDQINDLPDNEDDLAAYLQTLASAKGGVEQTANIIVDGFA